MSVGLILDLLVSLGALGCMAAPLYVLGARLEGHALRRVWLPLTPREFLVFQGWAAWSDRYDRYPRALDPKRLRSWDAWHRRRR